MGQSQNIVAGLLLVPIVVCEAYVIWFGNLARQVEGSPDALLYVAFAAALYAAWTVAELEYFPRLSGLSRRTQVWVTIGICLWCAGLILLWLEPRLSLPIFITFFAIADVLGFEAARDLLSHMWRRAGS